MAEKSNRDNTATGAYAQATESPIATRGKHARVKGASPTHESHTARHTSSSRGLKIVASILGVCVAVSAAGGVYVYRGGTLPSFDQPTSALSSSSASSSDGAESKAISADQAPYINDAPLPREAAEAVAALEEERMAKQRAFEEEQRKATDGAETKTAQQTAEEARTAADISASVTASALANLPESETIEGFSIAPDRDTPRLSDERRSAILASIQAVEEAGYECGFAFIDMQSGCGIAYRAHEAIYTASAFKAPFISYLLTHDDSEGIPDYERDNIEAAILYSDNDAYDALCFPHMSQEYIDWQESYGIVYDGWTPYYPYASAQAMLRIWADIAHYLEADDETTNWFANLLENTNNSFIREGLLGTGIEATVANKGGWLADEEYNAVTDCGIIQYDGRRYLMAILTDQPSSGEGQARVSNIAAALFQARDSLA